MPAAGEIRLRVFDVHGRCVRTLDHRQASAGAHTAAWDGRDASGRPVPPAPTSTGSMHTSMHTSTPEPARCSYSADRFLSSRSRNHCEEDGLDRRDFSTPPCPLGPLLPRKRWAPPAPPTRPAIEAWRPERPTRSPRASISRRRQSRSSGKASTPMLTARAITAAYLAHRRAQSAGSGAARHPGNQSRRPRAGGSARPGTEVREDPRRSGRRPHPPQRQHRHCRPHDHHRRFAGACRPDRRDRRDSGEEAAGRRRGAARQDQHERVGELRSEMSSSGWSARGGQCCNPYVLDRNPCGSSSGSGTAISANPGAAAMGTETDGSIVCPASSCGLVGLKPTVGLVSRAGIIPICTLRTRRGR